jgi:hypothetical protein
MSEASERLMEEAASFRNLRAAAKRVIENGGAPGVDGMTSTRSSSPSTR